MGTLTIKEACALLYPEQVINSTLPGELRMPKTTSVEMTESELRAVLQHLPECAVAKKLETAVHELIRDGLDKKLGDWERGKFFGSVLFTTGGVTSPIKFSSNELADYIVAMRYAASLLDAVLAYWEVGDEIPDDLADEIRGTLKQAGWIRE